MKRGSTASSDTVFILSLLQSTCISSGIQTGFYSMPTVWVKRPERETNHLPASNAEVYNDWSSTSIFACASWRAQGQTYLRFNCMDRGKMRLSFRE
jgi:hypothetical protein